MTLKVSSLRKWVKVLRDPETLTTHESEEYHGSWGKQCRVCAIGALYVAYCLEQNGYGPYSISPSCLSREEFEQWVGTRLFPYESSGWNSPEELKPMFKIINDMYEDDGKSFTEIADYIENVVIPKRIGKK